MESPVKRWQFRLRTILIAITLTSMSLALYVWVGQSREWIRQRHAVIESPYSGFFVSRVPINPPGGLWIFVESAFGVVEWYGDPNDLERVKNLFPEADVRMGKSH